jgi:hypothetical protein
MNTSITLQDLDEATAQWISEEAARRSVSVQTLILQLIRKGVSVEREGSQLQSYVDGIIVGSRLPDFVF